MLMKNVDIVSRVSECILKKILEFRVTHAGEDMEVGLNYYQPS